MLRQTNTAIFVESGGNDLCKKLSNNVLPSHALFSGIREEAVHLRDDCRAQ